MVACLPSLVQPQQICKHRRASLVERRMTFNQERHGVRFSQNRTRQIRDEAAKCRANTGECGQQEVGR